MSSVVSDCDVDDSRYEAGLFGQGRAISARCIDRAIKSNFFSRFMEFEEIIGT
jgi:hypothetical protein